MKDADKRQELQEPGAAFVSEEVNLGFLRESISLSSEIRYFEKEMMMTKQNSYRAEYKKVAKYFEDAADYAMQVASEDMRNQKTQIDRTFKALSSLFEKLQKDKKPERDIWGYKNSLLMKISRWMQMLAEYDNKAQKCLQDNQLWIEMNKDMLDLYSPAPPFQFKFWEDLAEQIDKGSGFVLSKKEGFIGSELISNEYMYKDLYNIFRIGEEDTFLVYFVIDTDSEYINEEIAAAVMEHLQVKLKSSDIRMLSAEANEEWRAIELVIDKLKITKPTSYARVIKKAASFINHVEKATEKAVKKDRLWLENEPLVEVSAKRGRFIIQEEYLEHGIVVKSWWRKGALLLRSNIALRKFMFMEQDFAISDRRIMDKYLKERHKEEWTFPNHKKGRQAEKIYLEEGAEVMGNYFDEIEECYLSISDGIEVLFKGYPDWEAFIPGIGLPEDCFMPRKEVPDSLRSLRNE